ncbi:uncharacterized protein LOC128178444 isoform X4 [Crassostrea angulata]|uniref:uncharacterized protein LOC128178444 isoform X4 n=1 Tax=Magallana angulata TaxID=2784310 RepID=UPI0022B15F76|nr:uncharacterized protein LOC128178444 isoform X4 [Crassostrea angulata]
MAGQYLDISDEVLQMHNEIRENGKYNYMICKINRERLVIEHIEQLDDLGNQPYQAFLRTLSAKQEFRYGFVVYNLNKDNNLLRKTVGVMWQGNAFFKDVTNISDEEEIQTNRINSQRRSFCGFIPGSHHRTKS